MRLVGALLFLAATTAQAQPIVGDEVVWWITSPVTTYKPVPQAARVAADGYTLLVTWSEVADGVSRVCAGRLDGAGHLMLVGVCSSGTADAATIVPFGDRYLAAWLEPEMGKTRPLLVTASLDRNVELLSSHVIGSTDGPPIVRAGRSRAFVGSGSSLHELDANAAATHTYEAGSVIDDVGAAGDQVGYVVHSLTHTGPACHFGFCSAPFDTYTLKFTSLFNLSNGFSFRATSSAL